MHLIQAAFTDLIRPVRSLAYQCAMNYISSNPSMSVHFMSAYSAALLHKSADISLHALSSLPEFITVSRCISENLLGAAAMAANRWPSPESTADLSRAVTACTDFGCADLEENVTSQIIK
ncbi:Integrator complex subunit [Dirofilaria immitis]